MNEIADRDWAKRVQALDAAERTRRLEAVEVLLAQPDELSTPAESELYILRDLLREPATALAGD